MAALDWKDPFSVRSDNWVIDDWFTDSILPLSLSRPFHPFSSPLSPRKVHLRWHLNHGSSPASAWWRGAVPRCWWASRPRPIWPLITFPFSTEKVCSHRRVRACALSIDLMSSQRRRRLRWRGIGPYQMQTNGIVECQLVQLYGDERIVI